MSDREDKNVFLNLLAGIGIGAILGAAVALMLAPKSGKETRDDLKKTAEEVKTKAEKMISDLSASAEELVNKTKEVVETTKTKVQQAVEAGKTAMAEKREAIKKLSRRRVRSVTSKIVRLHSLRSGLFINNERGIGRRELQNRHTNW